MTGTKKKKSGKAKDSLKEWVICLLWEGGWVVDFEKKYW